MKKLKSLMYLTILSLTFFLTHNTEAKVYSSKELKERLLKKEANNPYVNGAGITYCDSDGNEANLTSEFPTVFEECVVIFVNNADGINNLLKKYPQGVRRNGVFIVIDYIGEIEIQPKVTIGK